VGSLLPQRVGAAEAQRLNWATMKSLADCFLYGILDLGYVAARDAVRVARALVADGEGVDMLQIRAKQATPDEILALARLVRPITAAAGVPLILNDHPALVPAADAEGAHIGQDDGPLAAARAATGGASHKWLGRSTHSLAQARAARAEGADYLGFGPLFATPTKPDYPAIGLDDIARAHAEITDRPIFCIGGIKPNNLASVLAAGAQRVVIVSGLLLADDIAATARTMRAQLRPAKGSS